MGNCCVAFVRLIDRGLEEMIYATPLAQYAIRQVRDGRRVGRRLNKNDVSSSYAQRARGFKVENLDVYDRQEDEWKEVLVEDRHAGPAETAASRIDFADWLRSLPRRQRRVAETLATGETTKMAARRFRVSPGRISQIRRELMDDWEQFHVASA
jgi:DNA-binding NarL/FixJ family response regulator